MKTFLTAFLFTLFSIPMHAQEQHWSQVQKIVASDRNAFDSLGSSVAISGDYAIVGSPRYDIPLSEIAEIPDVGVAYIYKRNESGEWIRTQRLMASDSASGGPAFFGISVSMDGNYAIVGASGMSDESGAAYIFEKDANGIWSEVEKIQSIWGPSYKGFGRSTSLSGDYALIGIPGTITSGNVVGYTLMYRRVAHGEWTLFQGIIPEPYVDYEPSDIRFGSSMAFSGDYAFIGAPTEFSGTGTVYVLKRGADGYWKVVQKILASDYTYAAEFGSSVSMDGNVAVVGTAQMPHVYLFELRGNGRWVEVQRLQPSISLPFVQGGFGRSVAIDDNRVVVGAIADTKDALGNNPMTNAGSAFLFERDHNGVWNEVRKIVPADRNAGDLFGYAVAIDGDRLVAGTPLDDHDASGEDSVKDAGSAYIFEFSSATGNVEERVPPPPFFYPNPVNETLHIDLGEVHLRVGITLRDMLGQSMLDREFTATDLVRVDLDVPPGVYVAVIRMKDGRTETLKFLKR